jgi:hypothetical protein
VAFLGGTDGYSKVSFPYFFAGFFDIRPSMNRRTLYAFTSEVLPSIGSRAQQLATIEAAMRSHRRHVPAPLPPRLAPLASLLHHDDLLGQVYQAMNAPALEAAYRGTARDRRKFTPDEISAVTQLFTPKWVVEFLLQNTLGKLWLEMHPDSRLGRKWKWLTRQTDPKTEPLRLVSQLRICDPACGTMNFGLVAIDMLRQMYREEIDHAGRPGWPARPERSDEIEIDTQIIRDNLIGFDIDPTAVDLARQSLEIKIGRPIGRDDCQLIVKDALFDGSSAGPFDVIVTNPPYLSARNLDLKLVQKIKRRFPSAWRDHYACFMRRSLEMLRPGGWLGILSMHSFMFTGAFERFRRDLSELAEVRSVAHFGPGLFDIGNPGTLQTAAVVLERKPTAMATALFFRLVDESDKRSALACAVDSSSQFELTQSELASLPRSAWMYWISPKIRRAFRDLPRLGQVAPPRQGLATTDNARFVRYWWEVEPPGYRGQRDKWKPYAKGGRFRRWYESARHRVNWEDDGREIKRAIIDRYPYLDGHWQWVAKNSAWYGHEGITYSYLTSGSFSARRLEAGTIFDVAGSSLFPDDPAAMLGILNSSIVRQLLSAINPTVNFQVGDLRQLPIPCEFSDELRREVGRAVECTRSLDRFDEASMDFVEPEPWNRPITANPRTSLAKIERSINRIVAELYGMRQKDSAIKPEEIAENELAKRWISYALGVWLGRWGNSLGGEVAILYPLDPKLRSDLQNILAEKAGESAAREIITAVGGLDRFLQRDFLIWHNQLYRGRPIFWGFSSGGKTIAVHSLMAERSVMRRAFRIIGATLPSFWRRSTDDGVRINLAPLAQWISDRKLADSITEVWTELQRGQFSFAETSRAMGSVRRELISGYGSDRRRYRRRISPASAGR